MEEKENLENPWLVKSQMGNNIGVFSTRQFALDYILCSKSKMRDCQFKYIQCEDEDASYFRRKITDNKRT